MLKITSTILFAVGLLLYGIAAHAQRSRQGVMPGDRIPPRNPVTPPQPPANLMTETIASEDFQSEILLALASTRLQVSTSGAGEILLGWVESSLTPRQKFYRMRKELLLGCAQDPDPEECLASVRAYLEKIEQRYQAGYTSFIRWSDQIKIFKPGMKDVILDVPVIGIGAMTFLINNLHAVSSFYPDTTATIGDGGLNFSIIFSSDVPTIECVGSSLCPGNINISDARLSIKLQNLAVTTEGKLTYNSATVSFTGNISASGVLSVIPTLRSRLRNMVESKIREVLFTRDAKDAFANAMGKLVRSHISGDQKLSLPTFFYSVAIVGSDLVVKYTRPNKPARQALLDLLPFDPFNQEETE